MTDTKSMSNFKRLKVIFSIIGCVFLSIIIICGLTAALVTGIRPCLYTVCHPNATCYNRPFYGECICNYGFGGNGRDHCDECGLSKFEKDVSISGRFANAYSWPAAGLLEFFYSTFLKVTEGKTAVGFYKFCGISLINRRYVLTSANCIFDQLEYYYGWEDKTYTVKVEPNNFYPNLETMYAFFFGLDNFVFYYMDLPHTEMAELDQIKIHPKYNPITLENNIALIKLKEPIQLNDYIQITCLPNRTSNKFPESEQDYGYIAGYGSSTNWMNWKMSNTILHMFNSSMCDYVHPEKAKNWDAQFCAGEYDLYDLNYGNCHGDFGSSVYTLGDVNGEQKYITSGLLSYDVSCNQKHSPGVYTRVSYYMDWILENSKY